MSFWDYAVPTLGGAAAGFMMGGPVGAVAGGAAGAAGAYSAERQNQQQQHAVDEQRSYSTEMSNTAHQREAADLKKAGINPNLSANSGASTPGSNAAEVEGIPRISFPEVMQAKALTQKDAEIGLEKQKTAAYLAKNLTDIDLNKMDKVLKQKGMIRANLEGDASSGIKDIINSFKESWADKDPYTQKLRNERILEKYNRMNGTKYKLNDSMQAPLRRN